MSGTRKNTPLSVSHPELAKQADGWDPGTVTAGSNKKLAWKCKNEHSWNTTPGHRLRGQGCPYCSGRKVLPGFNDLQTLFPDIAAQMINSDPTKFTPGSTMKVQWKCNLDHIWATTINSRTSSKTKSNGCPYCAGQRILQGFNDLLTRFPALAAQADGWDPSQTYFRSNSRLNWKCDYGHNWVVSVANRVFGESGCPYCSGKKVLPGFNDLQTKFPELASQAIGWDPSKVSLNSHKKFKWKCHCGHIWNQTPNYRNIYSNNSKKLVGGCPKCAGKIIEQGTNDLLSLYPDIAKQADGWDPKNTFAVSHKKLRWKCDLGHLWEATVSNRTNQNSNCPVCSGDKLLVGFNDLQTKFPQLALEAFEINPQEILAGTHKKIRWRCANGHIWSASVGSRTGGGNGCPSCATSGFDPNLKAYLYFIHQENWAMYQIGITNDIDRRLYQHARNNWVPIEVRGPMDGHVTQQWETSILRMLRAKGADLANQSIAGKFDGFSEAWSKSTFEVKSIRELMRLTEEFEETKD